MPFLEPNAFSVPSLYIRTLGVGFVWHGAVDFGVHWHLYMGWIQKRKSRFRIETDEVSLFRCGACSVACQEVIHVHACAKCGECLQRVTRAGCGKRQIGCPRNVNFLADSTGEHAEFESSFPPICFADGKFEISSKSAVN